jgi:hypothetical protein
MAKMGKSARPAPRFPIHESRLTMTTPPTSAVEHPPVRVAGHLAPAYSWFKAAVFALLAWNTGVFLFSGSLTEGLDAAAWLVLLALFELETGFGSRFRGGSAASAIRGARLLAAAAVLGAAIGYLYEREWLDAINSGLWITVVALLEFEVRYPLAVERHRAPVLAATALLYSALGALVLIWAWQGLWFDAYDAALWLIAFATIELNVLRPRGAQGVPAAAQADAGRGPR